MIKPIPIWIVIADSARARILMKEGNTERYAAVPGGVFEQDNPPTHEQGTERPGRTHPRIAGASRHTVMQNRADWHDLEKQKFAARIADFLNQAARDRAYQRLVLVAPPDTLGMLRAELDDGASAWLAASVAKDYTHLKDDQVIEKLADHLIGISAAS